jgi:DNA-directed RNA polymerase specialized sigma24 family protein
LSLPTSFQPAEYDEWLERVRSTYESVFFTCSHRLGDRRTAAQVSVQVVIGLLAKPTVFQYFGLPYSARIAHLAEERIAAARAGMLVPTVEWADLFDRLRELPEEHREILVLACVRGYDDAQLADACGVPPETASQRRDGALRRLRSIAD